MVPRMLHCMNDFQGEFMRNRISWGDSQPPLPPPALFKTAPWGGRGGGKGI